MKYDCIIAYPGGNTTLLVETPVERERQPQVGNALLKKTREPNKRGEPKFKVEQVGFIEPARVPGAISRLQMTGGEFCGNATRSLAAVAAWRGWAPLRGAAAEMLLEASGYTDADEPPALIRAFVKPESDQEFWVRLVLEVDRTLKSLPQGPKDATVFGESIKVKVISLHGITHLFTDWAVLPLKLRELLEYQKAGFDDGELPELRLVFEKLYNVWPYLSKEKACGFVAVEGLDAESFAIRPLVRVNQTNTTCYETACASATVALTLLKNSARAKGRRFRVRQPSGSWLITRMFEEQSVEKIYVEGEVEIIWSGSVEVPE